MNIKRKMARQYLNDSSLTNFWEIVREAKISDDDQAILDDRFVRGHSIVQIAVDRGYSIEKVNSVIQKAYDKIYNLIK